MAKFWKRWFRREPGRRAPDTRAATAPWVDDPTSSVPWPHGGVDASPSDSTPSGCSGGSDSSFGCDAGGFDGGGGASGGD